MSLNVLGLSTTDKGVGHWRWQRLSAVGLALLMPWFLLSLLSLGNLNFNSITAWIAAPIHAALLSLLVLTATYHSQLGLQVVVEDYVANQRVMLVSMRLINLALLLLGALGVFAVIRIALTYTPAIHAVMELN